MSDAVGFSRRLIRIDMEETISEKNMLAYKRPVLGLDWNRNTKSLCAGCLKKEEINCPYKNSRFWSFPERLMK